MKSVLFAKTKPKPAADESLSFFPIGSNDGRPVPDALERLKAFHAKYTESRQPLKKGQKGTVELVNEARASRARR